MIQATSIDALFFSYEMTSPMLQKEATMIGVFGRLGIGGPGGRLGGKDLLFIRGES